MCVTGVAGVIHLMGAVIAFGYLQYTSPSLLSNCFFQGMVAWTGAGLYYTSAVVRVRHELEVGGWRICSMHQPGHLVSQVCCVWVGSGVEC